MWILGEVVGLLFERSCAYLQLNLGLRLLTRTWMGFVVDGGKRMIDVVFEMVIVMMVLGDTEVFYTSPSPPIRRLCPKTRLSKCQTASNMTLQS